MKRQPKMINGEKSNPSEFYTQSIEFIGGNKTSLRAKRNSLLPHFHRTCSKLLQQICREEAQLPPSADLQVAVHLLAFLHHNLR